MAAMEGHSRETSQVMDGDYVSWTKEALISRIRQLETSLGAVASSETKQPLDPTPKTAPPPASTRLTRPKAAAFDFSRYSTRLIALKFAYIGGPYQGLEYHVGCPTPLPAVEEKLFEALLKSRLVPPKVYYNEDGLVDTTQVFDGGGNSPMGSDIGKWIDLERWQYTKCGRTDRGVSAFGQVVGVRVRSNRPKSPKEVPLGEDALLEDAVDKAASEEASLEGQEPAPEFDDKDELPYVTILNRLLPPTIRVLAWCPNPPEDFSARFNCKARTYHYFFTNPPAPPNPGEPPKLLDVEGMKAAAKHYEGLHDFRNVCKIDASKQITNFKRRVEEADVIKVGGVTPVFSLKPWAGPEDGMLERRPEIYCFKLTGSAFLWHQVRHMVAILFLVGQRLEKPEVVKELLDVQKVPTRPFYNMADDRPLVLWDCIFDEKEVKWVYPELNRAKQNSREDVLGSLWELWHNSNMDALLSGGLLAMIYGQQEAAAEARARELDESSGEINDVPEGSNGKKRGRDSTWIVDGSPMQSSFGKYVPLMERGRMDPVEVINRKFAARKSEEWRHKWSVAAKKERGIGDMTDYDE
ncbi:hypothetical protein Dda_7979 [Drechslerella dactyloides]|uniref:Pseudouridine synthase I TruA alpha/beta domain-containing protein n=1 Tax=Drechslerella dactyloides TaxID=74499 RepID=A0AAD6NGA0_DREDA|nr:hypothetical protein Dda_7979 [Drechslerella dactyloides]